MRDWVRKEVASFGWFVVLGEAVAAACLVFLIVGYAVLWVLFLLGVIS